MRIINPSFGHQPISTEKVTAGAVDWLRDPIILFSNSKPNAMELLDGLRAKLGAVRSVEGGIDFISKDTASRPAPPEMIDMVAHKYKAALLALGD